MLDLFFSREYVTKAMRNRENVNWYQSAREITSWEGMMTSGSTQCDQSDWGVGESAALKLVTKNSLTRTLEFGCAV